MTRREMLEEQYEDAYLALIKDVVAEQEGTIYKDLNDKLNCDPNAAVPADIDQKCRKLIDRHFEKQKRQIYFTTAKRILNRAAIVAASIMLLFTTAFAVSEDFRRSTLNVLITVTERYTQLHMDDIEEPTSKTQEAINEKASQEGKYFDDFDISWIPEGFVCINSSSNLFVEFQNEKGQFISIDKYDGTSTVQIDTENADEIEDIEINGIHAIRVTKDGDVNCILTDTERGIFIRIWTSSGISKETNQRIIEGIFFTK